MRFTWSNTQIYPDQVLESRGLDTTAAEHFLAIFQTDVLSIPLIVIVMLLMFVLCHLVLTRTKFRPPSLSMSVRHLKRRSLPASM